jgi:ribosomal-protein-alanine N-acetyltransferase
VTYHGDIAPPALLLSQFRLMVDYAADIDIHAESGRATHVILDPGVSADPHTDTPAIYLNRTRTATRAEIPLFVPAQKCLAVDHRRAATVDAHHRDEPATSGLHWCADQSYRTRFRTDTYEIEQVLSINVDRRRVQLIARQRQFREHYQPSIGLQDRIHMRTDVPVDVTIDNTRLHRRSHQLPHHDIVTRSCTAGSGTRSVVPNTVAYGIWSTSVAAAPTDQTGVHVDSAYAGPLGAIGVRRLRGLQYAGLVLGNVTGVEVLWHVARVRPMTVGEAVDLANWRYGGDWSVYDLSTPQRVLDNLSSYYTVAIGNDLIGFCCIGVEARVAGMQADPAIVDVGMGMNPQLVGRGNGARFGEIVLQYLDGCHPGVTLRAAVQAWNERSLRLTRRLGFEDAGELIAVQGGRSVSYRVVQRPLRRDGM